MKKPTTKFKNSSTNIQDFLIFGFYVAGSRSVYSIIYESGSRIAKNIPAQIRQDPDPKHWFEHEGQISPSEKHHQIPCQQQGVENNIDPKRIN